MKQWIQQFAQSLARRSIAKHCELQVARSARVNYRGFRQHPPSQLSIGEGSIFMAQISADREGAVVSVGQNTFVGGSHLVCAQRIEIGDDVLIAWGGTIIDHDSHSLSWAERKNDVKDTMLGKKDWSNVNIRPVTIGNRAWIGFKVTILRGVTIGEGAVIGACSVVTKDVAPFTVVAGNPARVIREIPHEH